MLSVRIQTCHFSRRILPLPSLIRQVFFSVPLVSWCGTCVGYGVTLIKLFLQFLPFQEALRHILIVFAKLNPGIRYVQGMNEVLAPLFYVFRSDPDDNSAVSKSISVKKIYCFSLYLILTCVLAHIVCVI